MRPPSKAPQIGPSPIAHGPLTRARSRPPCELQLVCAPVSCSWSARGRSGRRLADRARRRAPARRAHGPAPARRRGRLDRLPHHVDLGRDAAEDGDDLAAELDRRPAPRTRSGPAADAAARLRPGRERRLTRPARVRAAHPRRRRPGTVRARAAAALCARALARGAARGVRVRAVRARDPPPRGAARGGRGGLGRRRARVGQRRRARAAPPVARRALPVTGAPARPADARALSRRAPGRCPGRISGGAPDARRRAGPRAGPAAAAAERRDDPPGGRPEPERGSGFAGGARRGGRGPAALRQARAGARRRRPRARARAGGAFRVSARRVDRPHPRRAVRGAHEGLGAALRRAAGDARGRGGAERDARLPRLAAAAPTRAGQAAPAHRHDELRPCARAGLPRRRGDLRRRVVHGVRPSPGPFLPSEAGRLVARDRRAEHLRDGAVARASHRDPEAARRCRARELRGHGGRLHRLSRRRRRGRCDPGRARREAAAQPLPLPRLRDARVEPASRAGADVGSGPRLVQVVGGTHGRAAARAAVLARARRRPARGPRRRLRNGPRALPGTDNGGSGMSVTATSVASPYKGLAPFEDSEVDAPLFFGRERETEVIVANMLASKLTVLYGPSGVGKSSILRAAVARRLREIAPEAEVLVLDEWAVEPTLPQPDGEAFLILDQFEEYFLYHDAGPLHEALPALLAQPRVHVLLALREDALARLDVFQAQVPGVLANRLRLDQLDRSAARAAIVGPLDHWNAMASTGAAMAVEASLVEEALDEVESSPGRIEAPYLQLVMERVWEAEHEAGSQLMHAETLRELGGAGAIVSAHLERALGALPPRDAEIATSALKFLVTPSRTKIAQSFGDLVGYTNESPVALQQVLEILASQRILRAVAAGGGDDGSRYEIFHDVLAEPVLVWRRDYEARAALAAATRRHRRLAVIAGAAVLLAAAMVVLAIFAFAQQREATRQKHAAEVQKELALGQKRLAQLA